MKRLLVMLLLLAGMAGVCLMVGCEAPWDDDDDDASLTGTSTIQGNISSFDASTSAVIAGASYKKAGVTVKVKGTDKVTTTAEDGTFIISGLAAGTYTLIFQMGDVEVEYPIGAVADNARVEISNIFVGEDGVVRVEKIVVADLNSGTSVKTVDNEEEDEEEEDAGSNTAAVKLNIARGL